MRNFILIWLGIAIFAALAACGQTPDSDDHLGKKTGMVDLSDKSLLLPDFSLPSVLDGTIVSKDDFAGSVLLVNFFASWCRSCVEEISELKTLQSDFGDQDFSVIGIAVDVTSQKTVKRLVARVGINYPILFADDNVAEGFGGITIIPTSFLVNRDGYIVKKYLNHVDAGSFREEINQLLSLKGEP